MATCATCGVPLEPDAAACANCGRIVAAREQLPLALGGLFGILLTFVAWGFIVVVSLAILGGKCEARWPAKYVYIAILVGCLAALAAGIDAARRGYPARAVLFLIPAIGVLIPAAKCTLSVLDIHC
jgi:hypothetical protein